LTERREYLRIIWLFPAHIPSREIIFASVGRDDPGALLGNLPRIGAPDCSALQMRRYFLKIDLPIFQTVDIVIGL
jgi:hypothetical protein